jgi:hypothetical protein
MPKTTRGGIRATATMTPTRAEAALEVKARVPAAPDVAAVDEGLELPLVLLGNDDLKQAQRHARPFLACARDLGRRGEQ